MTISTLARLGAVIVILFGAACSEQAATEQSAAGAIPTTADATSEIPTGLLPDGVAPRHYKLHLNIDPRQETFSGTAEIDIDLTVASDTLWLHGRDLTVNHAIAILEDGSSRELTWSQMSPVGVASLTTDGSLPVGKHRLLLEYEAQFNSTLEGLHRVRAGDLFYAFTQFEATSARLAFPSFDQPGFKVPFDISLTVPEEYTGVTNTSQTHSRAEGSGYKTLTFATTRPLPTYLIAFAVGPFDVVEWQPIPPSDVRQRPLPLRGITTRGKAGEIHYALDHTADIVLEFESYFATGYPYEKLDLIAIPDFGSGAMENAGAITYREQLILLDENSAVFDKQAFFYTHAHELAHQWFGNLVTPLWWDDLWLKESFATWNAYTILDRLYPGDSFLDSLLNGSVWAMKEDGLSSARKIRDPIVRHEDIAAAYDDITYSKGGGVLAMFEAFLGAENFRKGIRHYMDKYAWKNATADDFIAAISEANPQADGLVLQRAFRSYIEQAGVPQLSVSLDCDDSGPKLQIQQQRYFPLGSGGNPDQTWVIPACISVFTEAGRRGQCFLVEDRQQTIPLDVERCPSAVLPNGNGSSYYHFAMSGAQWRSLLGYFDELGTREQIAVAGSLQAALNAGTISLEDYLEAVPTIVSSRSWRVATAPRADIYKLMDHGANPEAKTALQNHLRQWYRPQLLELDSLAELSPEQQQYRVLMLSTLALRGRDPELLQDLTSMARAYTGFGTDERLDPQAVDSNLTYIALLAAVDTLDKPFTDLLWKHFRASENATTRQDLLSAIASSTDPAVGVEARNAILSSDLADNEVPYILWGQMGRTENHRAMWEWTRHNLDAVIDRFPTWRKGRVPNFFSEFCDGQSAGEVEATFAPIIDDFESGERYLAKTLETIRLCAAFIQHYRELGPVSE